MKSIITYWNTLRYLKPIQIYGRIFFHLRRPRVNLSPPPQLREANFFKWCKPPKRRQSMLGPDTFRFLNKTHSLSTIGWDNPEIPKLWRYNLHYFEDLNADGAQERSKWHKNLILKWLDDNPPGIGTGWEPYPVSLRIVNWIKWVLAGHILPSEAIHSLAIQTRWLMKRLEFHLLGNHLLANAKALIFAGFFFYGKEAHHWLSKGLTILEKELNEQILHDGGHFELSTMYHVLVFEDILDLYNLTRTFNVRSNRLLKFQTTLREIASKMLYWMDIMCHPDGEISFFNDATFGITPLPKEIKKYAQRLGITLPNYKDTIIHLKSSGYIKINHQGATFFFDTAPLGPDYLLGHAHADTLSFELSLNDQRIIVNSGTSCYGNSSKRIEERGTAAHNTVILNGINSSEIWQGFRVARRARPFGHDIIREGKKLQVKCAHDGYKHLPGKPVHWRTCTFNNKSLIIKDRIDGKFHCAQANFHLHPNVKILQIVSNNIIHLASKNLYMKIHVKDGDIQIHKDYWHPEFGLDIPSNMISINFKKHEIKTTIKWEQ